MRNVLNCALLATISLALISEVGHAQAPLKRFNWDCVHNTPKDSAAIVTGPKFERLLTNVCIRGDYELGCTQYYTVQLYSFERIHLLRGPADFNPTTKFAADYEYSPANPQNWSGTYLQHGKRYTIYFRDDVTQEGYPVITLACELKNR